MEPIELIMLGTGNAAVTRCYNTCFAIKNGKQIFLTDAGGGNGILSQLEKANLPLCDIKDLFVTHAHTDHILGAVWVLRMVVQQMQKGAFEGDFQVYGRQSYPRITMDMPDDLTVQDSNLHAATSQIP